MPRGGARPNSGPKKGSKHSLVKALERAKAIATVEDIMGDGLTPLAYLTKVYRDENEDTRIRVQAAGDAATYVHQKQTQKQDVKISGGVFTGVAWTLPGEEPK